MVRLKDKGTGKDEADTSISIPYGSIKRSLADENCELYLYFNSLWFD